MSLQGIQGTRLWHQNRDFAFRGAVGIDGPEMGDEELTRLAPSFLLVGLGRLETKFVEGLSSWNPSCDPDESSATTSQSLGEEQGQGEPG
jgi:hypothetical protein